MNLAKKLADKGSDWPSDRELPLAPEVDFKFRQGERSNRDIRDNGSQIKIIFVKIFFVQSVKKTFEFHVVFLAHCLKLKSFGLLTQDALGLNILSTHLLRIGVLGSLTGPFVDDFGTNWYKLALFHI